MRRRGCTRSTGAGSRSTGRRRTRKAARSPGSRSPVCEPRFVKILQRQAPSPDPGMPNVAQTCDERSTMDVHIGTRQELMAELTRALAPGSPISLLVIFRLGGLREYVAEHDEEAAD